MKKSIYFSSFFLCSLLLFSACIDDSNQENEEVKIDKAALMEHYWICSKAERNGRPAASLDGLFFDFSTKDTLTSNMMGENMANPYKMIGDTIFQTGDHEVNYAVVNLDSTSMQLNMEMNATKFSFFLQKGTRPE